MQNQPGISNLKNQTGQPNGIYFIGIGGIGMSAIARYFHAKGIPVSGYDKTETKLTKELVHLGISVIYADDVTQIPKDVSLVVYTPAIPSDHKGLNYYRDNGYDVIKRSDVLQKITENTFNICIAGTHGKTTVSTMTAHILRHSGYGCNAFLGGISVNYGTNVWSSENNVCVVEADEYDRSFLKLSPDIAVITSMDADHLDIYHTATALQDAFIQFSEKVKDGGTLLSKFGLQRGSELKADNHFTYSLQNESAGFYASNIRITNGSYEFDVMLNGKVAEGFRLNMGGMHNVENIVAAISVANQLEIDIEKIKSAVAEFKGVKRRFEYIIKNEATVMVDDYAHHPEELRAFLASVRKLYPEKKLTVVFQPHLFSRTRDFLDNFADILATADELLLMEIYPARELPIAGVTSSALADKIESTNVTVCNHQSALSLIKDKQPELLLTVGAGDIDTLVLPLKEMMTNV